MMSDVPVYGEDLYTNEAILRPYDHYAAMRELGPLVYLPRHDLYAIPRYSDVRRALLDNKNFLSGHGVAGFTWPSELAVRGTLTADEPEHARFRRIIDAPLRPPALVPLTEQVEATADALIARLVERGEFDGMGDLASFLPVTIVSSLVGLPERGREQMLVWAAAAFDILGVNNDRAKAALIVASEMVKYVINQCRPETVKPDGWAAQIWAAVTAGKITPQEAAILHIDILAPALDTTIFATGHLLYLLATNPDQWALLKADRDLIPNAIDEAVRLESPIRSFARVVETDQDVGGATLPANGRVLTMYASANRDERHWDAPTAYNIRREGLNGHVGFGQGRHSCAGTHLAKLEMRSLLKSILARVERMEAGTPELQINNVLRGYAKLPMRFAAA